ncbi:MAG TPA: hypothetical protein VMM16_14245 [Verrucomicrobiae bacterium]|nr:hypothetical protein [Verrucomicrobiae bacterium]
MKNCTGLFLRYAGSMTRKITAGLFIALFASALLFAAAQDTSSWKHYRNSEYGFEIAYPTHWEFDANYVDNYGKTPPVGQRPAYAGETRTLFGLEMDGPSQSKDGGGSFDDGVIVVVQITGASGTVEDWNMKPGGQWYLRQSAPSDWVKLHTSSGPGAGLKRVAVDANGFTGAIQVVCMESNPCKPFEELGAAYRTLPSGRVLLVSWDREAGGNDFSCQKYFLPMLSSFKMLK